MIEDLSKEFRFVERLTPPQTDQLVELYTQAWWSHDRTKTDILKCLTNSTVVVGVATTSGQLVGFARVISDQVFRAVIFDLIVHESMRGKGIGAALVKAIISHDTLSEVEYFDLYCNAETQEYYGTLGFEEIKHDVKLMRYTP